MQNKVSDVGVVVGYDESYIFVTGNFDATAVASVSGVVVDADVEVFCYCY